MWVETSDLVSKDGKTPDKPEYARDKRTSGEMRVSGRLASGDSVYGLPGPVCRVVRVFTAFRAPMVAVFRGE